MKKKSLLWISALLLILAGCSSDDDALNNEITINEKNILGYWESTASSKGGLKFVSDGKIKEWNHSNTGQYSEKLWGYFWCDDEGTLNIQTRPKDSRPNPDELYYKVISLTKDRLVIRIFGGFAGTPLNKGYDIMYIRINPPD